MQPKHVVRTVLIVAVLLLIPFLGNWPWSSSDFVIAGGLLLVASLAFEYFVRKAEGTKKKIVVGAGIALALIYIWAELAVGIFNIPGISGN